MNLSRSILYAALILCACARRPGFEVMLLRPLSARDEAAAKVVGMGVADVVPAGETLESAASPSGEMANEPSLTFLASRAAALGAPGVCFVLPTVPMGRDFGDFPEEWQALARMGRKFAALSSMLRGGRTSSGGDPGAMLHAGWTASGRWYTVFVNDSLRPLRVPADDLRDARALFEPRAAPSENLSACSDGAVCLAPKTALWIESLKPILVRVGPNR